MGAQILKDLGVRRMRVLSAPKQMLGISAFDLEIEGYVERGCMSDWKRPASGGPQRESVGGPRVVQGELDASGTGRHRRIGLQ